MNKEMHRPMSFVQASGEQGKEGKPHLDEDTVCCFERLFPECQSRDEVAHFVNGPAATTSLLVGERDEAGMVEAKVERASRSRSALKVFGDMKR